MIKLGVVLIAIIIFSFQSRVYAETFGSKLCKQYPDTYACYKVKKGESWKKLFANPADQDLVMRINRINLSLSPGMKIAIPREIANDNDILNYAPLKREADPTGYRYILVSIHDLAFGAYDEEGSLLFWGPISTGKGYCPDIGKRCGTPRGDFAIYTKQGAGCRSTKYPVGKGGAPMPYCMFFYRGFALHGSYDVPGYHASHGCVRLFVDDAEWLNKEFVGDITGVPVYIRN